MLDEARLEALKHDWTARQLELAATAIFHDSDLDFSVRHSTLHEVAAADDYAQPCVRHSDTRIDRLHTIAGLDVSFDKSRQHRAIATIAVLNYPQLAVVHTISRQIKLVAPYIPSFLSMREAEPLVALIDELRSTPSIPFPQVFLVDGNGRLHERQAGLAVAVGVLANVPTIGCAKDFHPLSAPFEGEQAWRHSQKEFKARCKDLLQMRADWIGIYGPSAQEHIAAALLTSPVPSATNPVFVSPGHRVSLETAIAICLHTSVTARVPEPIRQADATSRREIELLQRGYTNSMPTVTLAMQS